MIQQIDISNFRSIKKQSISLKKINVLYGPNGSGKSSVMYAPYVFRNFCRNPNQRLDSLFNLGFINLGGFDNVKGPSANTIEISIVKSLENQLKNQHQSTSYDFTYRLELSDGLSSGLDFSYGVNSVNQFVPIDLPYTLTERSEFEYLGSRLLWNGLTFEKFDNGPKSVYLQRAFNGVFEEVNNIELISVRRGFFNPIFSTEQPNEESQFALNIRNQEKDFESKIDYYFRKIFDKTFRFVAIPGSTSFYLKTQNSKGVTTDLVNEGFGVNQTIYMLINLLKKST
ncbi:MAG: AAA family ATPase [Chitinophagaceae bacterium]